MRARSLVVIVCCLILGLPAVLFAQHGRGHGGGGWHYGGLGPGFGGYGGYGYGYAPYAYGGYYGPYAYGYAPYSYGYSGNYGYGAYSSPSYSGSYTSGYRGSSTSTIPPSASPKVAFLGVKLDRQYADVAIVNYVFPNSTAAAIGLRPGDQILELDGTPVTSWHQVKELLSHMQPGKTIKISVGGSKPRTLQAVLGSSG